MLVAAKSDSLREETEKTVPHKTAIFLIDGARITCASPVEQTSQSILSHVVGFHLDRLRVVIGDKASVTSHTVCCANLLINVFFRPRSR